MKQKKENITTQSADLPDFFSSNESNKLEHDQELNAFHKDVVDQMLSIDKLKMTFMFLTTKYALTQNPVFAEAAYQHLCMLNDRCDTDPELQFLSQSLAMDWYAIGRKRAQATSSEH